MKTTLFLILFGSSLLMAENVHSQKVKVNLEYRNVSLKQVLNDIEQQTDYLFLYNEDEVNTQQTVSVHAKGKTVKDILTDVLSTVGIHHILEGTHIILTANTNSGVAIQATQQQQRITVTGSVVDERGESIIGASIMEKGTTNGTITDLDGNFSLSVQERATLQVSYIGYKMQEVALENRRSVKVTLREDSELLEEVVVIGYGTARKSDVTGAIASVNESKLKEVPVSNISQALQGRIAGVNIQQTSSRPGKDTQIRVRGTRSLSASNDPLLVVDGIPFGGTLNDIAPDDIKSIDILKDASSTAIYGSRGANGVVLITTNRGAGYSKPQIYYNGYYGFGTIAKKYQVFNAEEFVKYRDISGYEPGSPYLTQEQQYFETGKSYDWQDELYQTATISKHDLSFRVGKEGFNGNIGAGYYNETSPLPGQEFTRYSLRGVIDLQMNKWLKIGLNTQNTLGFTDGEGLDINVLSEVLLNSPLVNPYDENGNIIVQPLAPREDAYSPLLIKNKDLWKQERQRYTSINSLYAEIQILPELKYRANVGLVYMHDKYGTFYSSESPFKDGAVSTASLSNNNWYSYTIENLVYYDKTFAQKHRVGATLMYSVEDNYYESSSVTGTDMTADYMSYHNLGMANQGITAPSNQQIYQRRTLLSYMGRLNYIYDNKYMATVTFRSDGASVLAKGKKWHSYPAISLAWNMQREKFLQKAEFLDMLKIRLGYGKTSNQSVAPYATMGALAQNKYNFGEDYVYGYYSYTIPNKDLGWEFSDTWNAGLDFSFWNGRLSGSIDTYIVKTHDLLVSQRLPTSSGVPGNVMVNVGKTENKGIELTLRGEIIRSNQEGGLNWEADFNLSRNQNKLLALNSGVTQNQGDGWFVGYPVDVIYDYKKLGIWQLGEEEEAAKYGNKPGELKIEDRNKDYKIDSDDRYVIHTFEPDAELGLTNRLTYKGFDFTMVAHAQIGGTLVSTIHQRQAFLNSLAGRRNNLKVDYWTPDNPTNAYPKPDLTRLNNSFDTTMGYFDASYLKIQTITLGYTLPKTLLSRFGITNTRAYVTCNNVATLFSPYMRDGGVDVQPNGYGSQGTPNTAAIIQSRQLSVGLSTPPTRQFLFGLSFTL